mmetsp:Transcript_6249/g.14561  ORF Transcript_6249/g.14561 Transcript_6249/m.14561 type:complete len:188 (-) Transcript_6249:83-646(-)
MGPPLQPEGYCGPLSRFRPEIPPLGGALTFPFLHDATMGVSLNESADIARHLWEHYSASVDPSSPRPTDSLNIAPSRSFASLQPSACAPPRRQADPPSLEVPRRTVTGRLVCPPPPPPARPHARPCLGPRLPPDPAPARGVRGVAEGEGGSELPADGVYSRTLRTRGVPSKPQRGDPSPRRRRFRVE